MPLCVTRARANSTPLPSLDAGGSAGRTRRFTTPWRGSVPSPPSLARYALLRLGRVAIINITISSRCKPPLRGKRSTATTSTSSFSLPRHPTSLYSSTSSRSGAPWTWALWICFNPLRRSSQRYLGCRRGPLAKQAAL
jgi:hypothetical protein